MMPPHRLIALHTLPAVCHSTNTGPHSRFQSNTPNRSELTLARESHISAPRLSQTKQVKKSHSFSAGSEHSGMAKVRNSMLPNLYFEQPSICVIHCLTGILKCAKHMQMQPNSKRTISSGRMRFTLPCSWPCMSCGIHGESYRTQ